MPYTVTLNAGLKNVVLPNGLRYSGGAVVTLSDEQYAQVALSAASLFASVNGPLTLLLLPSASYGPTETHTFVTSQVANFAVDMTITSLTGGTSPTITLFIERQGADGNWYPVISATGVTFSSGFPQTVSIDIGQWSLTASGPFNSAAQHNAATNTARIRWTTTGSPTAVVLSASVIGR